MPCDTDYCFDMVMQEKTKDDPKKDLDILSFQEYLTFLGIFDDETSKFDTWDKNQSRIGAKQAMHSIE